jgi:uroporphyrinogen-III synthase
VARADLKGFTVAITADRRRDEQAVLMERLGVEVLMFPLLRTEPEDPGALRALTEVMVEEPPTYFVANTGYGMRTWLALAADWGLQEALVRSLRSNTAIAARGAKALGEIRKVGLDAWYKAPTETLEEVIARLTAEDLDGASVLVQLHGEAPGTVVQVLERTGARLDYLPVYKMGGGGETAANELIDTVTEGVVDLVTFTAAPQVEALMATARARATLGPVVDAFNGGGVVAACIGPVCANAARDEGISSPLVPEHSRLGSLASAIGDRLTERQLVLRGGGGPVYVSGRLVEIGGQHRCLGSVERRLLRVLSQRPGEWVDVDLVSQSAEVGLSNLVAVLDGALETGSQGARLIIG